MQWTIGLGMWLWTRRTVENKYFYKEFRYSKGVMPRTS